MALAKRTLVGLAALAAATTAAALDRLDAPAVQSSLAGVWSLTAVATAGDLAIAVGPRGHVLRSEDGGATWAQASVPARVDLTAVQLRRDGRALAVGHDGLVLSSDDGGRTWTRRLDGREVAALLRARHPGCDGGRAGDAVRVACEQGPAVSFLDVWVGDDGRGLAVGAFDLVLWTEDGGRSWTPWLDRSDNPHALHLYAVRPAGDEVLVAGEQGLLLRLDRVHRRLDRIPLKHPASLFGLVARGREVVAYGLGGRVLRSADAGATWTPVETGIEDALVGGATLPDGRLVLVSRRGDLVVSADGGRTFAPASTARGPPAASVAAAGPAAVVVAGASGARRVDVP